MNNLDKQEKILTVYQAKKVYYSPPFPLFPNTFSNWATFQLSHLPIPHCVNTEKEDRQQFVIFINYCHGLGNTEFDDSLIQRQASNLQLR